ncbi:DUF6401 family natural product biosynthesis protein [Solwaraspora sp. WMMD406]|uniref:DUF6401 family natural product biosynthesis protein n=1 Tax=Solwaraspora sp. WMMD406 TaxID=3016095 RepID=UPI002415D529|nr:DUF6401 family natural product biosynthesis protein [Solwaraspora sp. WMMD406]MDG4766615.1 DUF6401 family natural product biosynthesis protein [Solwaraspora sp. WMMD406]
MSPLRTSPRGLFAAPAAVRSARDTLVGLQALIGEPGVAAAAAQPGLLAEIDQHSAAIRDRLLGDFRPLSQVTLARYAEGVRDAAIEVGWQVPTEPMDDWSRTDWVSVRLLAVCHLATR